MKNFLKEPLLHFLLIGAAFFVLYSWVGEDDNSQNTIVIDESDLDEIVSKFEMQWKRNPTEEELTSIVEKRIEEEVFYQEALKMNLDHNDEIIKRRLAQKMQFLSNDLAQLQEPSTEELQTYFKDNEHKYVSDSKYTFHQIIFLSENGELGIEKANLALSKIGSLPVNEVLKLGDRIAINKTFNKVTTFDISRQFGDDFQQSLAKAERGKWVGPIESGFGHHLVYVSNYETGLIPTLDEVKPQVLEDYLLDNQASFKESVYTQFRNNYTLEFDVKSDFYTDDFIQKLERDCN